MPPTSALFEYKVMPMSAESLTTAALNQMGSAGWYLVATMPSIIFVRQMSNPAQLIYRTGSTPTMLLTIREASEQLRVSRTKLYEIMKTGRIKYVRLGRTIRIPQESLVDCVRLFAEHG